MRYKYFPKLFTTAALAGALTLSAAPQAGNYPDPETQTTVVQTNTTMSDHHIRHEIRKAIFHDATMSNRAREVRVFCKDGEVTLKGSVPTTMEKEKIEAKAVELAGSGNVVDQIKVKHHNYIG
jgi:osmotically-inducible protein OsmY